MIDIREKSFVIVGLKGSGKTELSKHILRTTENHMVYDPLNEYAEYRNYVPTDRYDPHEASAFVEQIVLVQHPDLVIFDEMNSYTYPKPKRLRRGIAHLVDFSRHEGVSFGSITRRPSMLHTDIFETANYIFVFRLTGQNDLKKMRDIHGYLPDHIAELGDYEFVICDERRNITTHAAIDLNS